MKSSLVHRLTWTHRIEPHPGLSADVTSGWVSCSDPHALRRFALERTWPPDTMFVVTLETVAQEVTDRSHCGIEDLTEWDPALSPLPAHQPGLTPPVPASTRRFAFLRAIRLAVDQAVEDDVVSPENAIALLLTVNDLVVARRRA